MAPTTRRLLDFGVCLLVPTAWAEEPVMSHFTQSTRIDYIREHQVTYVGIPTPVAMADELVIGDVNNDQLTFYLYITGPNGHICGASGIANAREGAYYFTKSLSIEVFESHSKVTRRKNVECRLRIWFNKEHANVLDEQGYCKPILCGTRAGIGNSRFTRKK
jgi:hypothetical protein